MPSKDVMPISRPLPDGKKPQPGGFSSGFATGAGGPLRPLPLVCLLFCLSALSGCGAGLWGGSSARRNEPDSAAARVTSVSRVYLPASGGQTIMPPQLMGDAQTLWAPLSDKERVMRAAPYPASTKLDKHMIAWLPPGEEATMNRYLYRLTRERRDLTERVLQRTEEHLPVVLEHLNRQGLPLELACLPMVESAFEPRAVSAAGAAGLWQLMPDTARRFGLVVKGGADERFDVAKSSAAAAAYLDWLYQKFGDWPLALAAYNCGEGSMQRALERSDSDSLSALTLSCRNAANPYLKEETLQFVPQFAAVVLTMSQSDKLGLRASPLLALGRTGGGYRDFSAAGRSRSSALRPQGPYGTDGPGGFGGPNGACDPPEPGGPQGVYASGERAGVRLSLVGDYSRAETPEAKPAQSRRISK